MPKMRNYSNKGVKNGKRKRKIKNIDGGFQF